MVHSLSTPIPTDFFIPLPSQTPLAKIHTPSYHLTPRPPIQYSITMYTIIIIMVL